MHHNWSSNYTSVYGRHIYNLLVQNNHAHETFLQLKLTFHTEASEYIKPFQIILICLSIGTPKTINFPFVPDVVLDIPIFKQHIMVRPLA